MIQIDGSFLEGGGQIVRNALALSVLTGKSFEVVDIRKNRPKPGLKAQHVHAIKALEQLCNAKVSGAEIGSEKLVFEPGKFLAKNLEIDIGTAGSISLLLQSLILPCFFADKPIILHIKGGTAVKWAMPIEYLQNVFVPQLRNFCEKIEVNLDKRGYFPVGGGMVEIRISPSKFSKVPQDEVSETTEKVDKSSKSNPIIQENHLTLSEKLNYLNNLRTKLNLTNRGKIICIGGVSHASKDLEKSEVAERQARRAKNILSSLKVPIEINCEYSDALCTGSGIALWALFENLDNDDSQIILGSDALGEKSKNAEFVGDECVSNLLKEIKSKACVDKYLADNLIPWMALIKPSKIKTSEITNHTLTNIYTTELFLGKSFEVDEKEKVVGSK